MSRTRLPRFCLSGNRHGPRVGAQSQEGYCGVSAKTGSRGTNLDRHRPRVHVSPPFGVWGIFIRLPGETYASYVIAHNERVKSVGTFSCFFKLKCNVPNPYARIVLFSYCAILLQLRAGSANWGPILQHLRRPVYLHWCQGGRIRH